MTALPRNQYSTTFSLDGLASPASPHRGRQMPHTFKPTPLRAFTVVVSAVPADQLRQHSTAPSTPGFIACALDGAAGVAGVGGPPAMAGSVPASGAVSMSNNFLANASFGPASSSFAFTKSFGDVFTRKKAAGATAASSDRMNGSFSSQAGLAASASAAAAAAAAVQGLSDPTVSSTPVPNSLDSYRVHLLLPPTPVTTEENSASASATAAAAGAASRSGSATCRGGDETDGLSAATSSLDALRTPKRRQAAQVSEHWLLFQQLVRFVLSVAPRFEPPATPPGFAFPVDLGLSFVQNSSMFAAAEATQLGRGGNSSYPVRQSTGLSSSFFASPTVPPTAAAEDPLVSGDEREARRNYMEAYLNAALQCDQVNCLKELQSFVGYDTYLKNELAHFRAMSHTSSSSSIVGSPATGLAHHGSVGRLNGSRADFTTRGPLGSSSQSTSSRSQCTVSTASSVSPKGGSGAARETALLSAPALATASASAGVPMNVPSSRGSELSPPQLGSSFSASPPALARSVPYPATDGDVHGVPHVRGGVGEANSLNSTASGRQEHNAARFLRHDGSGSGAAFSPSSSGSHHPPVLSASSLARQPRGASTRTSLLLGAVEVEDGSSRHSSQSAGSSFGSSVSHPGSGRRRRRRHLPHHHHRTPSDPASKKARGKGDGSGDDSDTEADAFRRGERRGGNGVAGHEEERAAAPPPLPPPASAAGLGAPTRADLRSLVSMAPETERMLTECFRMMDTTGCGYVSAGDCVLFYLCATPDTFVEALYYYGHAVGGETGRSTAGEAAQDAAASSSSTEQLEALLPTWMRECESVVVGNPHYLMSCARFVDAVREILAVSAGAELISTPAVATASTTAAADGERASTATRSHSKTQTSVSGDATSRNGTPASSLASPSGLPTVLVGSVPSRDGRRGGAEGTPLQAHSSAEQQGRSASPPSGASPPVAAPVASLEAWIDNYWLLLYSHLFAAVAAVVVGEEATVLRAALFSIRERAYVEMAAQVATTATALPARHASPLAVTCPPWVLREVSTALATQPPILGCFNALELMSLVYVITESGIAVVGLEDVLQWLGTRNCAASTRFSLDDFASLLDVLSCSLPFTDVLRCLRHAHHPPTEAGTTAQQQQQQQERVSAHDASLHGSAPPALLLRLVSRCATADPSSGHEFNELVREQRWRRSDTGAAVGGAASGSERGCAQCALTRGVMEQQAVLLENLSTENAALQQRIAALEAAVTMQMSGSGGDSSSNGKATTLSAACTPAVAPQSVEEAASTTAVGSSPQPTAASPSAATATAAAATLATAAPHRTTLELIPVFTAEHHDSTHSDALNSRHPSSRQPRAAVTQVARAGPLLYTVPARYARRQPSELEVSFYLCRAGLRTSEMKAAAVERLTLRDASGHRVLACKLSGSVLHILGRDTAPPRTTRLSLVTEPLSPTMGRWSAAAAAATASSPHRSRHRHGVAGRAPNILFPCYDDSDGGESGEAASVRLDSPARLPRSASDCDPSLGGVARLEHIASARASLEADAEPQRRVARVVLQSHVWYTLKLRMNWAQHTVEVAVVTTSTSDAAADAAQSEPFSSGDTNGRIFEDTFGMLDAANAAGLTSLDVLPRREMLVAYCNVLMRYDAPDK